MKAGNFPKRRPRPAPLGRARVVVERKERLIGSATTHVVLFDGRLTGVYVVGLECGGKGAFGHRSGA